MRRHEPAVFGARELLLHQALVSQRIINGYRGFGGYRIEQIEIVLTQLLFDPTMMGSAAQAERPAPPDDTAGTGMTGMVGTTP